MGQLRAAIGFTGMLLFAVSALIWITMVLVPAITGAHTAVDLGTLIFWTVVTLVTWRLGGGKGWGFAARTDPAQK